MSSVPLNRRGGDNGYPTRDGKPMAESDLHAILLMGLIETLRGFYAVAPLVHVGGNLLMCYDPADGRRHVSPDVFVAFDADKELRDNWLVWEEGPPRAVIELTSRTTSQEDTQTKFALYRDVLRVREYFLFDPRQECLSPAMQG